MDSWKEVYHGIEDDEIYLAAVTVSTEDAGDGQKRSPNIRRKKFIGNKMQNFGVRSTGLQVAARKTDRTSGILASRAMPAYNIYTQGLEILESGDILGIIDFRN